MAIAIATTKYANPGLGRFPEETCDIEKWFIEQIK